MPTPALLLVDDDTFTRTTLAAALSGFGYQTNAFEAASTALSFAQNNKFQVAILDLDLGPGPTGIDLAHLIRRVNPAVGVIFLTSYSDPRLLPTSNEELPLGARYLLKSTLQDLTQLVLLIEQATVYPLKTSQKTPMGELKLNRNQIQILKLIAAGMSTSQIADELKLSVKAVEAVISRINVNLGIADTEQNKRVQLAKIYYQLIGKI